MAQPSKAQQYWRGRLADFPHERPEGFDVRWWEMLSRHVLDGTSMGDLATDYGISKGRVQQLLADASARMREVVDGK